jgi:hypothetical protein
MYTVGSMSPVPVEISAFPSGSMKGPAGLSATATPIFEPVELLIGTYK